MNWNRWRHTMSGRLLAGVGVAALAIGLGACESLKGPPAPPVDSPPQWVTTTVHFRHTPTGPAGAATGWVSSVTAPVCTDAEGPTTLFGSVSNGSLFPQGGGVFTWTRHVTGSPPVTRVTGTFTVDCKDSAGQTAHPTISVLG
jgi:hypothetical protein